MARGFEAVSKRQRKHLQEGIEVQLPTRADKRSAGYDFYSPATKEIPPHTTITIWTNVKAYMEEDEVLSLYVRSSIGIKSKLMLANIVGIVDSSYYGNPDNDGNIGIALYNYSDTPVTIAKGDRIAQGIFQKYLVAGEDTTLQNKRLGGFGHSGK